MAMSTSSIPPRLHMGSDAYSAGRTHRGCSSSSYYYYTRSRRLDTISSCWVVGVGGSEVASTAFTLGTAGVLPFYTLMILAPKAQITRRAMESNMPYAVLGIVYAYLVYLSWTPDTMHLMFDTKYWLPELPGIAKLFSSEMTLASAWIHLLTGDLFAARCIYQDGLEKEVETRHSLTLCMFIGPIGILTHIITKACRGTSNQK